MTGLSSVLLCVHLLVLLVWRAGSFKNVNNPQDEEVLLRRLVATTGCENATARENEQVCYNITLKKSPESMFGYECVSADELEEFSRELNFTGGMLTISSPNFDIGVDYPESMLCLYSIPSQCPNKTDVHRVQWTGENDFVLEPAVDFGFAQDTCSDLVNLITTSNVAKLRQGGAVLRDKIQPKALCGSQGKFGDESSGPTPDVTFYSSNERRARGFEMMIQCTPAVDGGSTIIQPPPGEEGPQFFPPIEGDPDRVDVPDDAFIIFNSNTLTITRGRSNFEVFFRSGITRLFFWTGFSGTRVFETTADVPDDEIFGGGRLIFVNGCAYYATFNIPPRFIPNVNEVEILNVILRALSFFSSPRDQGDSGSGEPTGPPGTEGPTGPPGTGGGPQDPHKPHKGPILPDPLPPGYDLEAVQMGCQYMLSTNPFLRQAIADYFDLLGIFPCPAP